MAEIVRMPKLSDTMTDGVVAKWHKKVGDKVKSGELLADIETDKATMEFESFQNGVLLHIGVQQGKSAPVDSILAILGNEGEDITALLAEEAKQTASAKEEAKAETKVEPAVEKKETVAAPVQTTKSEQKQQLNVTLSKVEGQQSIDGRLKISPLARKLAEDKGIPVTALKGSGDGGRIVKRDIDNYKANGIFLHLLVWKAIPKNLFRKCVKPLHVGWAKANFLLRTFI